MDSAPRNLNLWSALCARWPVRRLRRDVLAAGACYAAVVLPLLVLAVMVWRGAGRLAPTGDEAILELAVRGAFERLPLVGLGSPRLGVHHPGPLYIYLLMPGYWLAGERFAAIALGAVVINLVAACAILAVVRRRTGNGMLVWATLLLLAQMHNLGMDRLAEPWTAAVTILPSALVLVLLAGVAQRHAWYLPPAVLAITFLVQTHLVHAPVVFAGLVALAMALFRPLRFRLAVRSEGSGSLAKALPLSLALGVVLWLPPVVEQWQHQPGNLQRIVRLVEQTPARHGWEEILDRASAAMALGWLGRGLDHLWGESGAGAGAVAWLLAVLLPVGYLTARRSRRSFEAALALLLGMWLLVSLLLLRRTVGRFQLYLIWWMSNLELLILLLVGGAVSPWLARWFPARRQAHRKTRRLLTWRLWMRRAALMSAGLLIALGCGANLVEAVRLPLHRRSAARDSRRTIELSKAAIELLKKEQPEEYQLVLFDRSAWPVAAGMALALDRQGMAPRLARRWAFLIAPEMETDEPPAARLLLYSARGDAQVPSGHGLRLVARVPDVVLRWRGPEFRAAGTYSFARLEEFAHQWSGFAGAERSEEDFFRWSLGERSLLVVPLHARRDCRVQLWAKPLGLRKRRQELDVWLNGRQLARLPMPRTRAWLRLELHLPAERVRALNRLEFRYGFVESPRAVWGQKDTRPLAVCFREISFEQLPAEEPLPAD